MKQRLFWSALLGIILGIGLLGWFEPRVEAGGARAPKMWRCVNPGGTDGCYSSIQTAINVSLYGDAINVWAGTYNEHITIKNGVSIYGAGWDKTIINGNYSAKLETVGVPEPVDASTVISGVLVTGGGTGDPNTSADGGGFFIHFASPTIVNTVVYSNTGYWGGGIMVWRGSPSFTNVSVWNNRGLVGGGYYIGGSTGVTITGDMNGLNGTLLWNSSADNGGAFYITNTVATLAGLRVTQNTAVANGGGIYATLSPNLQVVGNLFDSNTAEEGGGGVYLDRSGGLFQFNAFMRNAVTSTVSPALARSGGAALITATTGITVQANWFEGNSGGAEGGGLMLTNGTNTLINANTIVTNTASQGGGVWVDNMSAVTVTNNIIARNVTAPDLGITAGAGMEIVATPARVTNNTVADNQGTGLYFHTSSGIVIANNIIANNTLNGIYAVMPQSYTIDYNDLYSNSLGNYQWVTPGAHDLSLNPLFVGNGNMAAFYHLQPASPVGATGSLTFAPPYDIDAEPRIFCVSMGADQIVCKKVYLPLIRR